MASPKVDLSNHGDEINMDTFNQILDLDEDDGFSREVVFDFIERAKRALKEVSERVNDRNLKAVCDLGRYLTSSAESIGATKVADGARKIKYLANHKNESGEKDSADSDDEILKKLRELVGQVQSDVRTYEEIMKRYYDRGNDEG